MSSTTKATAATATKQTIEEETQEEELQVALLCEGAQAPVRASAGAAGYDLFCCCETRVAPRGRALVETGVAVAIPPGCYGRVAPRSGLALRHGIATGAGVIDSDYRGPLRVLLFNHSDDEVLLPAGTRFAQLVLERIATPPVRVVPALSSTLRGTNGFGSTGL